MNALFSPTFEGQVKSIARAQSNEKECSALAPVCSWGSGQISMHLDFALGSAKLHFFPLSLFLHYSSPLSLEYSESLPIDYWLLLHLISFKMNLGLLENSSLSKLSVIFRKKGPYSTRFAILLLENEGQTCTQTVQKL